MADKGFDLKVIIPTDDGQMISSRGMGKASYYLMYNVSNRSYQLAGKIKASEYFKNGEFEILGFNDLCDQNEIDKIVDCTEFPNMEIGEILSNLIDIIDKKTS